MRRAAVVSCSLAGLAGLVLAIAHGDERGDRGDRIEPVLHEYVAPPKDGTSRVVTAAGATPGAPEPTPAASQASSSAHPGADAPGNPTAIRQNDKILVEPPLTQPPAPGEPTFGQKSFAADRETESRPDTVTRQDGTLHYAEVFNPSVVPFKRMSSLDGVRTDYTLVIADAAVHAIPVGGHAGPERDLFWGSLILSIDKKTAGKDLPIPSVAPDMRVLSYESDPPVRLTFGRDAADNYYVRTVDPRTMGRVRVVFLVDAPAAYFAPQVPKGYTVGEVAAAHPPSSLPPRARESAATVLDRIGVTAAMPLDEAVNRLVSYFRGFQPGDSPRGTFGDVYLDLALSKRGVCRHRAFAFMVTANAAGLPARYVSNEAHAFAELWVPERGWQRVDLGGAALRLDVANANDKTIYRPRGEDPFPKPPAYADNYTKLRGVTGLSEDQLADARRPLEPGHTGPQRDPHSTDPVAPAAGSRLPRAAAASDKKTLGIAVDGVDRRAFRGEAVRVTGHLRDGGRGVEGLRVDIYLAPAGAGGDGARLLGQTVSDATGAFTAQVDLPPDLLLGQHEVYAVFTGNATYAPAVSD